MGRKIPKQVYVVTNEKLGISIPVMLLPDLTFSAAFQGKRFNAATAEEVQKWCWDAIKSADDLVWKPVIVVSYMEGRDQRPYTRIPNVVSFDFERSYLAKRMDGTILKSPWELTEGATRTQIAAQFYDSEALGDLSEWPVKVSHKFSDDPTIVYIEYTDDLWAGLEKLSEAIEMLRETLTGFLGSVSGHEKLASIGQAGLLPSLWMGEAAREDKEESDA